MNLAHNIAQILLDIQAIGFNPDQPVTFKSGIKSPVYVDNRRLPFHPVRWRQVIEGFRQLTEAENIVFDVVAGIEAAGIPHSAALGYALEKPSVFVRKQAKDHGTKRRVEGGNVAGKHVLLIEDLVTTGGSSLSGVLALREEGAIVSDCLAIFSYGFSTDFPTHDVQLHTLTNFDAVWHIAKDTLPNEIVASVETWHADPQAWGK